MLKKVLLRSKIVQRFITGAIIVVVLVIAYNLVIQITTTMKSGERLSSQAEIVYKLEAKNRELKKKLTQIQSSEFIEEQARDKLGLAKPGETVIIIPEDKLKSVMGGTVSAQQLRLPNWLGWWRVFFK